MNSAALVLKEVEILTEISLVYARKDNFNNKCKHFANLQLLQTVEMKHGVFSTIRLNLALFQQVISQSCCLVPFFWDTSI